MGCLRTLTTENRNCHHKSPRGKQTQARWMDGYAPPSCVEHPHPVWSMEGPQETGYHGSWEKQLGRVHRRLMGTFVGYICYVRLEKNSLHFGSTYFPVHMLYFTFKNSIKAKQNKTPGWEAKPKPGAANKEFQARMLSWNCSPEG